MSDTQRQQEKLKQNLLSRMKRVEGQVRGIQKMIDEGKECEDVLIQVRAARSALQSASRIILKRNLLKCVEEAGNGVDATEAVDRAIRVVTRYVEG